MAIEFSTAFAMRCPICGRLDINQLNIFQLSGDRPLEIFCDCGSRKATISRKGVNYIVLQYYCIICSCEHSIIIPKKVFWSKNNFSSLVCLDTDLNLGYFGSYKLIKKEIDHQQEELNSMANELGFDDFANPEIMLDILDFLHDLAAQGGLFCNCGSHDINIELFFDRVRLSCNNCNSSIEIPASCEVDLDRLKKMDEVVIKLARGSNSIDSKDSWINVSTTNDPKR